MSTFNDSDTHFRARWWSNLIKALKTPAHELFKLKHFCSSLEKVHSFQIEILGSRNPCICSWNVSFFTFSNTYGQVLICELFGNIILIIVDFSFFHKNNWHFLPISWPISKKQLSRGDLSGDWSGSVRTLIYILSEIPVL